MTLTASQHWASADELLAEANQLLAQPRPRRPWRHIIALLHTHTLIGLACAHRAAAAAAPGPPHCDSACRATENDLRAQLAEARTDAAALLQLACGDTAPRPARRAPHRSDETPARRVVEGSDAPNGLQTSTEGSREVSEECERLRQELHNVQIALHGSNAGRDWAQARLADTQATITRQANTIAGLRMLLHAAQKTNPTPHEPASPKPAPFPRLETPGATQTTAHPGGTTQGDNQ